MPATVGLGVGVKSELNAVIQREGRKRTAQTVGQTFYSYLTRMVSIGPINDASAPSEHLWSSGGAGSSEPRIDHFPCHRIAG